MIKGERYNGWRSVGVVAQGVKIHGARGVDELMLLDIEATNEARCADVELVEELSRNCFMPLSVGGGVKSLDDIRQLLAHGADKVVIGAALFDSTLVEQAADSYGAQCITVSIDYREDGVYSHNGTRYEGQLEHWVAKAVNAGAGELLVNAIDREGTLSGYDLDTITWISRIPIPVIASGGCKDYQDMANAVNAGASAVAAGAFFQFTGNTPGGAAEYLAAHDIVARIP